MTFYQKLMGTRDDNLKHVDIEATKKGKQLTPAQRECLLRVVTKNEIW